MPDEEVKSMAVVGEALNALEDSSARQRVLRWAWSKYAPADAPIADDTRLRVSRQVSSRDVTRRREPATGKPKQKSGLAIVRDLNLKPPGSKSFRDFVAEKQPNSNQEKVTVAVYYVLRILELPHAGRDHVYTCFKDMGWRIPSDLNNTLQFTASKNGWLVTQDMAQIGLTTHGENLVEHDLPRKKAARSN